MMFWMGFLVGIVIGAAIGIVIMCFCAAAGQESRRREDEYLFDDSDVYEDENGCENEYENEYNDEYEYYG